MPHDTASGLGAINSLTGRDPMVVRAAADTVDRVPRATDPAMVPAAGVVYVAAIKVASALMMAQIARRPLYHVAFRKV